MEKGPSTVDTWEGDTGSLRPDLLQPLGTVDEGLLVGHIIDETQDIRILPLRDRSPFQGCDRDSWLGTVGRGKKTGFRGSR